MTPDVPAGPRQGVGELREAPVTQQAHLVVGHLGVGVVEDGAEGRVAAQRERRERRHEVDALRRGGERVREEAERPQVAGRVDALRQQAVDLGIGQGEVARDADAVGDVDAEVVGGEVERPGVEGNAGRVVERLLGLERHAAAERRHGRDGRDGAVVHQVAERGVEDGRRC